MAGIYRTKTAHVGVVRVRVVYTEVAGIDFIDTVARVEIGQRSYAWTDPTHVLSMGGVASGAIIRIVDHELVFMCVAEEDTSNNMRGVPANDLVKQICRGVSMIPSLDLDTYSLVHTCGVRQWVCTIPACQNMTQNPYSLTFILGLLKLLRKEPHVATIIWICRVAN